jgi:hypothetical protein
MRFRGRTQRHTQRMNETPRIPVVRLMSREGVKWPRYQIEMPPGLTWKEAYDGSVKLLRANERQILQVSQFKYDAASGFVDVRVQRIEL